MPPHKTTPAKKQATKPTPAKKPAAKKQAKAPAKKQAKASAPPAKKATKAKASTKTQAKAPAKAATQAAPPPTLQHWVVTVVRNRTYGQEEDFLAFLSREEADRFVDREKNKPRNENDTQTVTKKERRRRVDGWVKERQGNAIGKGRKGSMDGPLSHQRVIHVYVCLSMVLCVLFPFLAHSSSSFPFLAAVASAASFFFLLLASSSLEGRMSVRMSLS